MVGAQVAGSEHEFEPSREADPARGDARLVGQDFDAGPERAAYFYRATPTAGTLFHHAIEMYLKAYLSRALDERQRRKLRHSLRRAWRRFKQMVSDPALSRFDPVIKELDPFEDLRYPEKIRGWAIKFADTRPAGDPWAGDKTPGVKGRFLLILGDIDALVAVILDKAGANPKPLINGLSQDAAAMLRSDNATNVW